jgi:hypothetical protein
MNAERRTTYPLAARKALFSILALGSCQSQFGDLATEAIYVEALHRGAVRP